MEEGFKLFAAPPKKKKKLNNSTSSPVIKKDEFKDGENVEVKRLREPEERASKSGLVEFEEGANVEEDKIKENKKDYEPIVTFKYLGVSEWLCSICNSLGISDPTPVQKGCIPAILAGKDVVGLAQTGSGKTAAFALPILQALAKDPYGVFAIVLTPTRELAIQISEQFRAFGAGMSLKECVIIGGMDMQRQAKELARRPHVVIATPGRLRGLLESESGLSAGLRRTRFLVLDEADRLLDESFSTELRNIRQFIEGTDPASAAISPAPAPRPFRLQTLLFSATMTEQLVALQREALSSDTHIFQAYEGLKTADNLKEQYLFVPAKVKDVYLHYVLTQLLPDRGVRSSVIFCATRQGCRLLGLLLEELGIRAVTLHSGKSQRERLASLSLFKSETVPLLIATDVASRGLDIPTVDAVVHYDIPHDPSDYVHRSGRTARAGRDGLSLSLLTQHDVARVHAVEKQIGHQIEPLEALRGELEAEALKGITKVYSAKRTAMLKAAEAEGLDTKSRRVKKAARSLAEPPAGKK